MADFAFQGTFLCLNYVFEGLKGKKEPVFTFQHQFYGIIPALLLIMLNRPTFWGHFEFDDESDTSDVLEGKNGGGVKKADHSQILCKFAVWI